MQVAEIWRYPVKTLAGEKVQRATIGPLGIAGDRIVHVEDANGRVITSRSHPRFLGHKATLGADLEPLVDGRPWRSLEVAADVQAIVIFLITTSSKGRSRGPVPGSFETRALSASTSYLC